MTLKTIKARIGQEVRTANQEEESFGLVYGKLRESSQWCNGYIRSLQKSDND